MKTEELIAAIEGKDETARADAWQKAGPLGSEAVAPLAEVMAAKDTETHRAATRALWKIVRHAGRPGAGGEAAAVSAKLIGVLQAGAAGNVAAEVAWMLSEIAGPEAVASLSKLLASKELREHARAALQRIPGDESLAALKAGLAAAQGDHKPAMAESLRRRGVEVPDVPCEKLKPTRSTKVKKAEA